MARVFLVPVDFSKGSETALDYAISMARNKSAKLILLHVIPAALVYPTEATRFDFYAIVEGNARASAEQLARRKKLMPRDYQLVLVRGADIADVISRQAKKLRAAMIVMGSHGRTGLRRFFLGSVAERTLRYAECPVLIVK